MDEETLKEVALAGIYLDGLLECEKEAVAFWLKKYPRKAGILKGVFGASLDTKAEEEVEE